MDTSSFLLTNGKVVFALQDNAVQPQLCEKLLQFLAPYFRKTTSGTPQFSLIFREFAHVPGDWKNKALTPIIIRKSSVEQFYLTARTFVPAEDQLVAFDEKTATAYHLYQSSGVIEMYISEHSFIHIIELVRYLSLMIEEALGSMLLHATATIHEGAAYLILGQGGSGKTTTMLHMVYDHGHQYLSGDKVLVSLEDTGILIRGWPDYPHIGIGTFQRFHDFRHACGVSLNGEDGKAKPPTQKEVLDFESVRRILHGMTFSATKVIAALIFPHVSLEETSIHFISGNEKTPEELLRYIEYPHQFGLVQWHSLLPTLRSQQPRDYSCLLAQLTNPLWLSVSGVGLLPTDIFTKTHST
jgi:energy-coupling factor transporter ATP-binding protein EcfA2